MKKILVLLLLISGIVSVSSVSYAGKGTLTWNANTETDLAGYNVYCGKTSGIYNVPIKLGKVTTYTVDLPTLTVDQKYFCVVTAYDLTGHESGKSNEVNKLIVGVPVIVLGTPTNFRAVTVNGKTTLSWDAVSNATGYLLRVHKKGTPYEPCNSMVVCSPVITTRSMELPLPAGDYDAWVHAATSLTVFGLEQGIVFTVPLDGPPLSPQGLSISKVSVDEVIIAAKVIDCRNITVDTIGSTSVSNIRTIQCVR